MSRPPKDTVDAEGTLLPPSPSFVTHSFVVPALARPPISHASSSSSYNSSACPVSYEVHTIGRRGRPSVLRPLNLTTESTPDNHGNATSSTPNPFSSPPSTPGASVRSFASSSSNSSLPAILPPVPQSPPPIPPRPADLDLYDVPFDPRPHPSTVVHRRTRSRAARDRERYSKGTSVQLTPPTTAIGDRNSHRDTFSSPAVVATAGTRTFATGASTPSTRPGSSKRSGIGGLWVTNDGPGDQTYNLDFAGLTDTLKVMQEQDHGRDARYTTASFSSISIPFCGADGGTDTDIVLRPSRLLKGEVSKPWLAQRDWRVRASWWVTVLTGLVGVGGAVLVCLFGYWSVPMITSPLCLVMSDDFDTFNTSTWHHEIDMSGFGNGEFEMTTQSPNNTYIKDGMLYIVPTLTSDVIGVANVFDAFTYNITGCTSDPTTNPNACGAVSNATAGTVINPVMSSRITTQKSFSIGYGKVEIRAKMPVGDWLWPALWMLPVDNTYGPWPASGEIDLVEARGNSPSYGFQGLNYIRSSLNWGPTILLNRAFKTFALWFDRRGSFGSGFHTFTMEWTPDFLRVYVDTRIRRTLDVRFNTPFWARGDFPSTTTNNSETIPLVDPWAGRGNSAPFDQQFFLIMNVAVGGTNGWFPDNIGGKPWVDGSRTAMRDFAEAQDQWYPTWPANPDERGMVIDYVKMWQLC